MTEQYPLLSAVDNPADLKKIPRDKLPELAAEVADLIKMVVHENGGHYSSPLGVVDLTIALHYAFDSPQDQLIWDVGHQAYAHKILTGRRDEFRTLRTKDGLAGFLRRSESEYDVFGAGHASTAISAALGIAEARKLVQQEGHTVAIIGDGGLTGGLAYEGLNNLGFKEMRVTVVLNDNHMSISPTIGSFSTYLTRIASNPLYNRIRDDIWNATGLLPLGSKAVRNFLRRLEEGLKSLITPGLIFEELGLRYFGPINGHDYDSMLSVFKNVKNLPYPTLVHVLTEKGRGAKEAEGDSLQFYSLAGRINNKPKESPAPDYNQVFGRVVCELASADDRVACITAAMEVGTGLTTFAKEYAERYHDVGIAEGHAVTFAGGLATQGVLPVVAIYSTFLQRAYDHVVHDIAIQNLPVIFCLDRAGVVGPDGPTHHGIFDLAFLGMIPGMVVCAPKNGNELRDLLFSAVDYNCPVSIRYPKDCSLDFDPDGKATIIPQGTWEILRAGSDVVLLAVGSMVAAAQEAATVLAGQHGLEAMVVNCRFVKPLDEKCLKQVAAMGVPIITIEEGILTGGFGSTVQAFLNTNTFQSPFRTLGIGDEFVEHASREELLEMLGLTPGQIVEQVLTVAPIAKSQK
ncbi:MAG: 1-deoxy-D-xylulose-5-phosphate synthase [Fidelibacterota bacterium]|nr:MAG: 1-deoxy-D-xylulose-5-phosphate synthase [Candidatus Neomarinimicrobiota bacterium]